MKIRMLDVISEEISDLSVKLARKYIKKTHGQRSDICVVTHSGNKLVFNSSLCSGLTDVDDLKSCRVIRNRCGQSILNTHGPVGPTGQMPVVKLILMPSAIRGLAGLKLIRFLKDWPGTSEAQGLPVAKYIL